MKKVEDFTDQELEQQIEMLQNMDVMGSKKLLGTFLEEKERREKEHIAEEEAKKANELKLSKEAEEKRSREAKNVISAVIDHYDKCYLIEKNGYVKYLHVRGVFGNDLQVDAVYKCVSQYGSVWTKLQRRIPVNDFKELIKDAKEVTYTEFNKNWNNSKYSFRDGINDFDFAHFFDWWF